MRKKNSGIYMPGAHLNFTLNTFYVTEMSFLSVNFIVGGP